jgi:hypothetical protein
MKTVTTSLTPRRFDSSDWECWSGCERFFDGSAPFILTLTVDNEERVVLLDGQGVHVCVGEMESHYSKYGNFNEQEMALLAQCPVALLLKLGFVQVY